jgi:tetratricopeptide (TPR) repeat protein
MAGVESYSPCPCGSGEKYKWCCQKVEAFAERAERLVDSGQLEAAIKPLDEGLKKFPASPWLLMRKGTTLLRLGKTDQAKTALQQILDKQPRHLGALVVLTRCVLENEGPVNGAGMFQQVLATADESVRPRLASLAQIVAILLGKAGLYPAALKHIELVTELERQRGQADSSTKLILRELETSPSIDARFKDRHQLLPAPEGLEPYDRSRFEESLGYARQSLWAWAAAGFDLLSANDPGGAADFNLALCRLWLGDQRGAVGPLRRHIARLGATTEAVELEILAQLIEPTHPNDRVDLVQLTWPLRNRAGLLQVLRNASDVIEEEPEPDDFDEDEEPEEPEVVEFRLLDRPMADDRPAGRIEVQDLPREVGRVMVGPDFATLEAHDDGRLDALGDRFTVTAGATIAPAHPKTRVVGSAAKSKLAVRIDWSPPGWLTTEEVTRLAFEYRIKMLNEVWPETPLPCLRFRSPTRASKDGDAVVPLRAAISQIEVFPELENHGFDFKAFRARFGLEPEPAIDPATVDIDRVPLARLRDVPADQLDDTRLLALLQRTRRSALFDAFEPAALAFVARPALVETHQAESLAIHADLSALAAEKGDRARATQWIERGRAADSPANRGPNAVVWDLTELRLAARFDPPETWVPELAIVLERYAGDARANQMILMNLVEMGLVRAEPNPDAPGDILLDSRPLQAALAEFGPRVTTASGRLGVSATKPDLWTPGGPSSSTKGGALWTPGSDAGRQGGGDAPKLIIPGR